MDNGRETTNISVLDWVKEAEKLGIGEILLTSVDKEGTQSGFDLDLIENVATTVNIPVIACGGAGSTEDIEDLQKIKSQVAVCISSLFHYNKISPSNLKKKLFKKGLNVRIDS